MSGSFHKLLKDFPMNVWMDAADTCEFCGAKYQVKITWVNEQGTLGDVEWRVKHAKNCPSLDTEPEIQQVVNRLGFVGDVDVAGWEFMPKPFELKGKQYYPLKSRANIGPCLECGKLIIGVPLILFIDEGRGGELDFCWQCVKRLGLLEMIL